MPCIGISGCGSVVMVQAPAVTFRLAMDWEALSVLPPTSSSFDPFLFNKLYQHSSQPHYFVYCVDYKSLKYLATWNDTSNRVRRYLWWFFTNLPSSKVEDITMPPSRGHNDPLTLTTIALTSETRHHYRFIMMNCIVQAAFIFEQIGHL